MKLPDDFGKAHQRAFEALFPRLNQADGIHPTAEGAAKVTDTVWKVLEPQMRALGHPRSRR